MFLVGVGGFIGSIGRYAIQEWMQRIGNGIAFPFGTLTVNIIGCAAIGFLGGLSDFRGFFSVETRAFLSIGVIGGFTTYSAYGFETIKLLRAGEVGFALTNVALHFVLGFGSVWAGYMLARK